MPNQESSWTTVASKAKTKSSVTSNKSSGSNNSVPVIPQAEIKTTKLSDSLFSAMKSRIVDENDEKEQNEKTRKNPINQQEKNSAPRQIKPPNGKTSTSSLTLKQALQNIDVEKFKEFNSSKKERIPLIVEKVSYWFVEQLKAVTSGHQDPLFSKENSSDFPMNFFPIKLRNYFDDVFNETKSKFEAISLCQNHLLQQNIDLNLVVGYQILLQYLFRSLDEKEIPNLIKQSENFSSSFKRYPSDKVLRLLWLYGQIQHKSSGGALKLWFEIMFPLIENRTYNQFVIDNLADLTSRNSKKKKFYSPNEKFPVEQFLELILFLDQPNPALTKELRVSLSNSTKILSEIFSENSANLSRFGVEYFRLIFPFLAEENIRSSRTETIINETIFCTMNNSNVLKIWLEEHENEPLASSKIFSFLEKNPNSSIGLSSDKDLRKFLEQLRSISEQKRNAEKHKKFLQIFGKNISSSTKRSSKRKSSKSSMFKWIFIFTLVFLIYRNWLWLKVAADFLLEDYAENPTLIVVKEKLRLVEAKGKVFHDSAIRFFDENFRSTIKTLKPYSVQLGETINEKSKVLVEFLEGPAYQHAVRFSDEVQKISTIVFTKTVRFLNVLFENGSVYTARFADWSISYLKNFYFSAQIDRRVEDLTKYLRDFDVSIFRRKFDELFLRFVKSV